MSGRQTWLNAYLVNWFMLFDGITGIFSFGKYTPGLTLDYISWTLKNSRNKWFWYIT